MNFKDFDDPGRGHTRERRHDPFADFDAREYGAVTVSSRGRHLRHQGKSAAQEARTAFARRARLVLACVVASMFTAGLSIFVHRMIANYSLQLVSASAAERRRIAIVDPADESM